MSAPTRVDRLRAIRDDLWAQLPDNADTPAALRQLAVWWLADRRHLDAYCEALMGIFVDLAPVAPDDRAILARKAADQLDELGRRLKDFADFVNEEVLPRLIRLERGLDYLEGLPGGDVDRYQDGVELWLRLRREVKFALPVAWTLAGPAAHLYLDLDPATQHQAEVLWGPLRMPEAGHFGPLFERYWPTARLAAVDRRARHHGLVMPSQLSVDQEPPSIRAYRANRRKR